MEESAAVVITASLGKLDQALAEIGAEVRSHGQLLTRFDERQAGWATKPEVAAIEHRMELALLPVAQQARAAHNRLDDLREEFDVSMDAVRGDFERHEGKIDALRLSWARASGLVAGGGILSGVVVAVITKGLGYG